MPARRGLLDEARRRQAAAAARLSGGPRDGEPRSTTRRTDQQADAGRDGDRTAARRVMRWHASRGSEEPLDDAQVRDGVGRRHRHRPALEDGGRERSASTVYGSAAVEGDRLGVGATGGSPPAVTKTRVGRSGGMLNGISTEMRPVVP